MAARTLNFAPAEAFSLWSVLAAIYHLGTASVAREKVPGAAPIDRRIQFGKPNAAQKAAHCLGSTVEELTRAVFQGNTSSSNLNRKLRSAEKGSTTLPDGIESLEAFVTGLYQEAFNAVIFLINRLGSTIQKS